MVLVFSFIPSVRRVSLCRLYCVDKVKMSETEKASLCLSSFCCLLMVVVLSSSKEWHVDEIPLFIETKENSSLHLEALLCFEYVFGRKNLRERERHTVDSSYSLMRIVSRQPLEKFTIGVSIFLSSPLLLSLPSVVFICRPFLCLLL